MVVIGKTISANNVMTHLLAANEETNASITVTVADMAGETNLTSTKGEASASVAADGTKEEG